MSFFGVRPLITPFCIFELFLSVLIRLTTLITHLYIQAFLACPSSVYGH
jgi:hypothetical protein